MMAKELIAELQKTILEYGDLEVMFENDHMWVSAVVLSSVQNL